MLVHWVKVIWAKDGGSGTQWGPAIIFSEKKSTSLNPMRLSLITIWSSLYKSFAALKNERVMAKGELWIEYPFAVNSKIIQNIYIIQRSLPSKGILCIPR